MLLWWVLGLILQSVLSFLFTLAVYKAIFARYTGNFSEDAENFAKRSGALLHRFGVGRNTLCGFLFAPKVPASALIVFVPGFRATTKDYLPLLLALCQKRWAVFAFDATGTGASGGKSAVGFSQILEDLQGVLKYVENCQKFGYNEIILMGHSRGGFAACCGPSFYKDTKAVVSLSGVNSTMAGILGRTREKVGPLAFLAAPNLFLCERLLFGKKAVSLSAAGVLARHGTAALVVQSASDSAFPPDRYSVFSHQAKRQAPHVRCLLLPATQKDGHTQMLFAQKGKANEQLINEIDTFLRQQCKNAAKENMTKPDKF